MTSTSNPAPESETQSINRFFPRYVAVTTVGDNSLPEFLEGKEWAVIVKFPQGSRGKNTLVEAFFRRAVLDRLTPKTSHISGETSLSEWKGTPLPSNPRFAYWGFDEPDFEAVTRIVMSVCGKLPAPLTDDNQKKAAADALYTELFAKDGAVIFELHRAGKDPVSIDGRTIFKEGENAVLINFKAWLREHGIDLDKLAPPSEEPEPS